MMAESSKKTGLYTDLYSSKFYTCVLYFFITLSDFNALQKEVKCLLELTQKLVIEFKAVRVKWKPPILISWTLYQWRM